MFQDPLIRFLLLPFSFLYGVGVALRDFFYRKKLLMSVSFNIPVISVGNLSIGGAGKSPHIEYLIRLLKEYLEVATLSRGYLRKTKGFQIVQPYHTVTEAGDEPLMFRKKFPVVAVAVNESRSLGIPQILQHFPQTQVILLDDAFQHRSVRPGLNILLTPYDWPFTRDFLLPTGRLREWRSAYRRADIIIISKCQEQLTFQERQDMLKEIKPFPHQQVFFSGYRYLKPYYILNRNYEVELNENMEVLLICAIAGTDYLLSYLNNRVGKVRVQEYEDHHYFTETDLEEMKRRFEAINAPQRLIITTEKDAMRLELHRQWLIENQLPVVVLPVEVYFLDQDGPDFDKTVKEFLLGFKV